MSGKDRKDGDDVVEPLRSARTGDFGGSNQGHNELPWLLSEKVTIPDRVAGYSHRPELMKRILPAQRPVTVLNAPGGFGKTTLLAGYCQVNWSESSRIYTRIDQAAVARIQDAKARRLSSR